MNIQDPKFLAQVEQAVREAGQIFYDRTKASHMKHKGVTDFVTEVDLSAGSARPGSAADGGGEGQQRPGL